MKAFWFVALLWLLASCSNDTTQHQPVLGSGETVHATATDTLPVGAKPIMLDGCYAWVKSGDSAQLSLTLKDSTVTGTLAYRWREKDRNTGTIKGVVRDSLIYADYTFQSEGMTSVREVIFKLQNDQLLEATGDRGIKNNKIIYTPPQSLQFNAMPPFQKVACP